MEPAMRVLCVDDDRSVLELLSKQLGSEPDLDLVTEDDPERALEQFEAGAFDCVLADYEMPGLDGLELLAAVRDRDPDVPFVLLTGRGNEELASEAVSAGVTDYVPKSTGLTGADLLANRIRNAVEGRRARTNYREVVDAVDDALLVVDPETGAVADANAAACELWGRDQDELVGAEPADLGADTAESKAVRERLRTDPAGDAERFDWRCRRADGTGFWASVSARGAVIDGQERTLAVVREVTCRREHERALAALLDGTEDLVRAETPPRVVETAVDIAVDDLGIDPAALEPRVGVPGTTPSRRATGTDAPSRSLPGTDPPGGRSEPGGGRRPGRESAEQGGPPFALGTDDVEGHRRDLLQLLEEIASETYARASKAELLRERERELEERRSELARLNRRNEVLRDINRTLVHATSRDEIERLVCEQLVAVDPFQFAWIGSHDGDAGEVVVRARAGIDGGRLGPEALSLAADGPVSTAAATAVDDREVGVATPDPRDERPFGSVAVVPVAYGSVLYDVLAVYTEDREAFDEAAVDVLAELGETVGYAMHNAEQQRTAVDDTVVEVTLRLRSDEAVLAAVSAQLDARVEVASTRVDTDGRWRLLLSTDEPASPSALIEAHDRVLDARPITDAGDLQEVVVADGPLRAALSAYGARVESAAAEGGETRLVVELPGGTDVREFVERLEDAYGADLLSRRERAPDHPAGEGPSSGLPGELTDRQVEVLLAAYHAGFFEWPREQSGEDVAEGLGISQPTFHEHLRAAERTLLAELFDDSRPTLAAEQPPEPRE